MARGPKPRVGMVVIAIVVVLLVVGPLLMVATGMGLYLQHPTSTRGCFDDQAMMGPFIGGSFLLVSCLLILCILYCNTKEEQKPDSRLYCSLILCLFYTIIGSLAVGIDLLASVGAKRSDWLPSDINSTVDWKYNKRCLYDSSVCDRLQHLYANDTLAQFSFRPLSPVQVLLNLIPSTCFFAPEDCHFKYKSPTTWTKPANSSYANPDCLAGDNDPKKLCYNCQLCKLGVAHEAKNPRIVVGATTLAGSLMILGCCIIIIFTYSS